MEAQREDQEARIATLEQRYLATQREATGTLDRLSRAQSELITREIELKQVRENKQFVNVLSLIFYDILVHCQ